MLFPEMVEDLYKEDGLEELEEDAHFRKRRQKRIRKENNLAIPQSSDLESSLPEFELEDKDEQHVSGGSGGGVHFSRRPMRELII